MLTAPKVCLLFAAAFAISAGAKPSARPLGPREAYESQIRRLETFFRTRTQDEVALRSIYTRDAIVVEADGNIVRGRDAIAQHFKKILASGAVSSFKVTTTTFRTLGPISYAGGYEDIRESGAKANAQSQNRFLSLLRRERDGVWRFDYVMESR